MKQQAEITLRSAEVRSRLVISNGLAGVNPSGRRIVRPVDEQSMLGVGRNNTRFNCLRLTSLNDLP